MIVVNNYQVIDMEQQFELDKFVRVLINEIEQQLKRLIFDVFYEFRFSCRIILDELIPNPSSLLRVV